MSFLDTGMDAAVPALRFDPGPMAFDPGPTARFAGPLTRLRRSFAWPQASISDADHFEPGLNVQLAGPWTRARRTGSELVLDLPLVPRLGDSPWGLGDIPVERLAGLALRAAPVAVALVGTVVVTSVLSRPRSVPRANEAPPVPLASPAPVRTVEPLLRPLPPGQVEAKLVYGEAVLPTGAPRVLEEVVAAANQIKDRPYVYGGGHGSFSSSGYDCSGAVSYALHGAGLLDSPLASGGFTGWGQPGEGKAITVYANSGHAYAVIAGLRWDTSGTGSSGPSWQSDMRSTSGYVARHPSGY